MKNFQFQCYESSQCCFLRSSLVTIIDWKLMNCHSDVLFNRSISYGRWYHRRLKNNCCASGKETKSQRKIIRLINCVTIEHYFAFSISIWLSFTFRWIKINFCHLPFGTKKRTFQEFICHWLNWMIIRI